MEENKTLEEKNIIEKHTFDKQFKLSVALIDLENRIKDLDVRTRALEEAMHFFVQWYNEKERVDILVPEHLKGYTNK